MKEFIIVSGEQDPESYSKLMEMFDKMYLEKGKYNIEFKNGSKLTNEK